MRRLFLIAISILSFSQLWSKTITDMAGRSVTVPDNVTRILPYDIKMSVLLFPVAYDKMTAKALLPGSKSCQFIDNSYNEMPQVDVKNIEEVLLSNPQLIIAGAYIQKEGYERFEKLQERTRISVVVVDLSIDKLDQTYLFLGKLLGIETACSQCADFLKSVYTNSAALQSSNPLKNSSAYYTIGGSGLMTDPSGSQHTEVLDFMNITNVAKVPVPTGGHANVNMEQVLIWNPEYIFCAGFKGDKNAYNLLTHDSRWSSINAVKNSHIYKVPAKPFGWFDHPPAVNRIPGIIWLSEIFYGQSPEVTMSQIQTFYQLFYKYNLSNAEYHSLFE